MFFLFQHLNFSVTKKGQNTAITHPHTERTYSLIFSLSDSMDRFGAFFGAFGVRRPPRIWRCWKIIFLLSAFFHNYLGFLQDCPPTCTCSSTEIYCNKSDDSQFFPLHSFQRAVSAGNSTRSTEDLFQNITSM